MDKSMWSGVKKKVMTWIENSDPSVVVLYLPKPTKTDPFPQIKACGSPRLTSFINNEDTRKRFVDTAYTSLGIELKRPTSVKEAMPELGYEILECSMEWKRPKLSELVKLYMTKTKDMKSGYWGKEEFKPEFWPSNLNFKPATTNKAVTCSVLTRDEMDEVLQSYITWRSNIDITVGRTMSDEIEHESSQESHESADDNIDVHMVTSQLNDVKENTSEIIIEEQIEIEDPLAFLNFLESQSKQQTDDNRPVKTVKPDVPEVIVVKQQTDDNRPVKTVKQDVPEVIVVKQIDDPLDIMKREMSSGNPNYLLMARTLGCVPWEKFVDCCNFLEPIISRPERQQVSLENIEIETRFNEFLPAGTFAGKSLEQGDCLFSSISLSLTGLSDKIHHQLRVGAAVYGRIHLQHCMDKIIAQGIDNYGAAQMFLNSVCTDETLRKWPGISVDYREMILFALQEEVQITARPSCYSGPLQVMFLAGFLDLPIFQTSPDKLAGYNEFNNVFPCTCTELSNLYDDSVKILWLSLGSNCTGHVVPLFRKRKVRPKTIKKSDYIQKMTVPAASKCAAHVFLWCTRSDSDFMIQCQRCSSWMHPPCLGIPEEVYMPPNEETAFFCCWNDSKTYEEFPEIRLGKSYGHDIYLVDLISVKPGNWISDKPMDILCRHLNKECTNIRFITPDVLTVENSCKNFQQNYNSTDVGALMFVIVSSNHWWSLLLMRGNILEMIKISSVNFVDSRNEETIVKKICRIINTAEEDVIMHKADVPIQETAYDCGAFTAAYMKCLFEIFQSKEGTDTVQILDALKTVVIDVNSIRQYLNTIVLTNFN